MKRYTQIFSLFCLMVCPTVTYGQIVVDFTTDTRFNGMGIGDTVTLDKSNTSRYGEDFDSVFTLVDAQAIKNLGNQGLGQDFEASNQLNTSGNGLGVGGGADGGEQDVLDGDFDFFNGDGDRLSFNLSVEGVSTATSKIIFDEFVFSGLSANESFTLQSDAFVDEFGGQTFGDGVTFVSETGTFTFTSDGTQQAFELTPSTDLDLSNAVWAREDAVYTLAFAGGDVDPGSAHFAGFTFHAVPEPASMGLLAAAGVGFVVYRRRKKKVNAEAAG